MSDKLNLLDLPEGTQLLALTDAIISCVLYPAGSVLTIEKVSDLAYTFRSDSESWIDTSKKHGTEKTWLGAKSEVAGKLGSQLMLAQEFVPKAEDLSLPQWLR